MMSESFIRSYADDVLRYCVSQLGDMDEAEDAFMEVFVDVNRLLNKGEKVGRETVMLIAKLECRSRVKVCS